MTTETRSKTWIEDNYFTPGQAAMANDVSPQTIWRWYKSGKIKGEVIHKRLIMIPKNQVFPKRKLLSDTFGPISKRALGF